MAIPNRGVKWAQLRCELPAFFIDTETGDRPLVGAYLSANSWIPLAWCASGYHIGEKEPTNLDLLVMRNEI